MFKDPGAATCFASKLRLLGLNTQDISSTKEFSVALKFKNTVVGLVDIPFHSESGHDQTQKEELPKGFA